jgi:hypothetical protein
MERLALIRWSTLSQLMAPCARPVAEHSSAGTTSGNFAWIEDLEFYTGGTAPLRPGTAHEKSGQYLTRDCSFHMARFLRSSQGGEFAPWRA